MAAWKWADELLKENPKQPDAESRKNVAILAEVHRLNQYSDLSLVGNHAERFALDPDKVFSECRFDTVIVFAAEQKERHEFRERFQDINSKIEKDK